MASAVHGKRATGRYPPHAPTAHRSHLPNGRATGCRSTPRRVAACECLTSLGRDSLWQAMPPTPWARCANALRSFQPRRQPPRCPHHRTHSLCCEVHAVLSLPILRGSSRRTRRGLLSDTPPHRIDPTPTQRSSVRNDGAAGDEHGGFACATPKELIRREPCLEAPAVRTSEALEPPQLHRVVPTGFLRRERAVEFDCRSRALHAPTYIR